MINKYIRNRLIVENQVVIEDEHYDSCDNMLNQIKTKIKQLQKHMIEKMNMSRSSKPIQDLEKMYVHCVGFEPASTKLKVKPIDEGDIKLDVKSNRDTADKASEMSDKYEKDIELIDENVK